MLSLQNSTSLMHPWFARPIPDMSGHVRPHRQHHEFLAVSDESAASTTSTEEQISFYNSYKSSTSKKISENRPRSAQHTYGDFLDLPSGMCLIKNIYLLLNRIIKYISTYLISCGNLMKLILMQKSTLSKK